MYLASGRLVLVLPDVHDDGRLVADVEQLRYRTPDDHVDQAMAAGNATVPQFAPPLVVLDRDDDTVRVEGRLYVRVRHQLGQIVQHHLGRGVLEGEENARPEPAGRVTVASVVLLDQLLGGAEILQPQEEAPLVAVPLQPFEPVRRQAQVVVDEIVHLQHAQLALQVRKIAPHRVAAHADRIRLGQLLHADQKLTLHFGCDQHPAITD
uniref:Uncharacterized protein n=1 Tax=Anopheles farauti TaxID=69004 RepID=A0A182Q8Q2_9DIPT